MPRIRAAFIIVLLLATAAHAKRRAAAAPGGTQLLAYPLQSVTLIGDRSDLLPLEHVVGRATIVALGDSTHGTREFYTIKLRVIDYLVRERGFDVLSLEAPFPIAERINVYVQGGPGDPRALLRELNTRLFYLFWDVEELLAVIEWVRDYNLHRGERPPIEIAGADVYDERGGVDGVLAYLRRTDPAAAASAERDYACVLAGERTVGCQRTARRVRESLLTMSRDTREHADALQYAAVVLQYFENPRFEPRERAMAANLLWIREHRGRARKVVHWGHQEHVGKLRSSATRGETMGSILSAQLGRDYVAIGTLTGSGSFLQWRELATGRFRLDPHTYPDPAPGTYEWHLRARGMSAMLVPLRGRIMPGTSFRTAGTTSGWIEVTQPLAQKLDAVIYIDRTKSTKPLQ
ncbi:MAG TPA: erythromycin esterase family protein [Thermoanaerobaculia bacterium]|nr:erythromycin esterase family protein [Thermoanaerobaculia bacterium]